jgi:hypothetical protein
MFKYVDPFLCRLHFLSEQQSLAVVMDTKDLASHVNSFASTINKKRIKS